MLVCLSMYDLLLSPGMKGLRELNICEATNCKIKVCELDLENIEKWARLHMSRFLLHLLIYLRTLFYFDVKLCKKEHIFKTND